MPQKGRSSKPGPQRTESHGAVDLASHVREVYSFGQLEVSAQTRWRTARAERPKDEDGGEDRCLELRLREGQRGDVAIVIVVLDGHGGSEAVDLVAERFPDLFLVLLAAGRPVKVAFDEAFGHLETELAARDCQAGACVNACLLAGPWLWCANLGDCRACHVDLESLAVTWLSRDHQADAPEERRRIEDAGGKVQDGRVGGLLEPSRTLGDMDVKVRLPGAVSAEAEHRCLDLREVISGKTQALGVVISASDGLWRHLGAEEVVQAVADVRKQLRGEPSDETIDDAMVGIAGSLLAQTDRSDDVAIFAVFVDAQWGVGSDVVSHGQDNVAGNWGLEAVCTMPSGHNVELFPDESLLIDADKLA